MLNNNIRITGDNVVFTGDELKCYIPDYYFNKRIAEIEGDNVSSMGVFPVIVNNSGKEGQVELFNIPTKTLFYPSNITIENRSFSDKGEPEKYRVLHFYNSDTITKKYIVPNSIHVESFLGMLTGKSLPNTIPYGNILEMWQYNIALNGVNMGVPSVVLELVLSEIYRSAQNPQKNFGAIKGVDFKHSDIDYIMATIREICGKNSTFAATTFEDVDSAITTSINQNTYNKKQKISPVEAIIKY